MIRFFSVWISLSSILDFATFGGVGLIPSPLTNLVWIGASDQQLDLHGNGLTVLIGANISGALLSSTIFWNSLNCDHKLV